MIWTLQNPPKTRFFGHSTIIITVIKKSSKCQKNHQKVIAFPRNVIIYHRRSHRRSHHAVITQSSQHGRHVLVSDLSHGTSSRVVISSPCRRQVLLPVQAFVSPRLIAFFSRCLIDRSPQNIAKQQLLSSESGTTNGRTRNTENHPKNDVINVISEEQLESAEPRSID